MSQAEALLNSLEDNEGVTVTNVNGDLIVINEDRTVHVPDSLRRLGVQHDHNIETVTFTCPRYWDENDMSQMKIYVNYLRPDGVKGQYLTTNLKVGSNSMTFDWIISNNVTQINGTLSFLVCIVKTDADGMEERHWNSELNQECHISEGMECLEAMIVGYPDIITHLLVRMEEVESIATPEAMQVYTNTWLEENKDTVLAEIQAKGDEVLATIPADYSVAATQANEAVRTKADAIVCSASGETISISDSSDDYLRGLKIFGKTTQITTTGKNLVDLSDLEFSDSNYVHSFGPSNSSANDFYEFLKANTGKNIVISMTITGVASGVDIGNIRYYGEGDALICSIVPGVMHTVIELPDVFHACYVYGSTNGASIKNIQVEFGETATEYEPYSGCVASPSPEWAQELTNLSNPKVSIIGKNLLDMSASAYYDSGVIKTAYSGYNSIASGFKKVRVYPGHTYTFSYKLVNGGDRLILVLFDIDNNLLGDVDIGWGEYLAAYNGRYGAVGDGATFTIPADSKVAYAEVHLCQMNTCGEGNCNIYADLQFEDGSDATEYEPYRTPQTIDIAHSIPGIPVNSGANYTDANGQQWICDEIDFERGVYVQRIGGAKYDGNEYWSIFAEEAGGVNQFYIQSTEHYHDPDSALILSNYFAPNCINNRRNNYETAYTSTSAIAFNTLKCATIDEWKAFLAEKYAANEPIIVKYILSSPVEVPLTAEEIANYKTVRTNYHNTTVQNDSNAHMELEYNVDTKTYIDNSIKANLTDVMEAIENGSY